MSSLRRQKVRVRCRFAPSDGLEVSEGTFTSMPDENAVRFVFHRPSAVSKSTTLPCVVYLHGGGMVAQSCFYGHYRAWARLLARQGLAVLLVDFRNALIPGIVGSPDSSGQVAPYPAGLNDCECCAAHRRPGADRSRRRERRRQPRDRDGSSPQARRRGCTA